MEKIINLRDFYTGHPLRDGETWQDFYSDFGFYCEKSQLGFYDLYTDNTKSELVILMIPYKYYSTPVKISEEICYVVEDEMNFIFHLMYNKLLYSRTKKRLLPAQKLR